jgi:hypothetical protein
MPLEEEQLLPEAPVGVDSQEALAKHHECGDLHNAVGSEVMQLQPVGVQQAPDEGVKGEGEPTSHVVDKHDSLALLGTRHDLVAGEAYLG